jgi:outer membrane protein assembly factor BamB
MWKSQSITIPASYCKSNTLFRFEFLGDNGNNLYIDNINVSGVVGLGNELLIENNAMVVFPNPSDGNTSVYFKSEIAQKGKLKVTDVLGKVVYNLNLDNIIAGENHWEFNSALFNASGVYFVTIETIEKSHVQKFVIN